MRGVILSVAIGVLSFLPGSRWSRSRARRHLDLKMTNRKPNAIALNRTRSTGNETEDGLPACEVEIYSLTFPSPVKSLAPGEYRSTREFYRPGSHSPGVIVLDILGGKGELSRGVARHLAQTALPVCSSRWHTTVRAGRWAGRG
jgi:hypothetical protein